MTGTAPSPAGIAPADRIAVADHPPVEGAVTLINSFHVAAGRDEAFLNLWRETSKHFVAQPGFVSLRLPRAVNDDAAYRWVNIARWEREADYRAAHQGPDFLRVVSLPGWEEFPSSPTLYEVDTSIDAPE
jgi:heme-degrading monooxygenase HmoA